MNNENDNKLIAYHSKIQSFLFLFVGLLISAIPIIFHNEMEKYVIILLSLVGIIFIFGFICLFIRSGIAFKIEGSFLFIYKKKKEIAISLKHIKKVTYEKGNLAIGAKIYTDNEYYLLNYFIKKPIATKKKFISIMENNNIEIEYIINES